MVELLIVTKSKDLNGINYSFTTQLNITKEELEKSLFESPIFKLKWESGIALIAVDDISLCRINEIT